MTTTNQYPFALRSKKENGRSYVMFAISEAERSAWVNILQSTVSGTELSKRTIVDIEEKLAKNGAAIPAEDLEWQDSIIGKGK